MSDSERSEVTEVSLVQMSFSGAVLILMILIVRSLLMNRLPKKTFLALWAVALIRLLVPFSIPSAVSVYTLAQGSEVLVKWTEQMPRTMEQMLQKEPGSIPFAMQTLQGRTENIPGILQTPQTLSGTAESSSLHSAAHPAGQMPVPGMIWLAGALLCLGFFAFSYIRCCREFRMSFPVDNDMLREWYASHPSRRKIAVRQTQAVTAPLSYGILHPVILMPKGTRWEDGCQLRYILEHEYVHIRRMDTVAKLIMITALCIHWFNPFVWIMYFLFNRDLELSCDETVVRRFGEDTKSAYAMTLIRMEEKKSGLAPLCSNFGRNAIEERIKAIMKIKKASRMTGLLAAVLVAGITSVFVTSASNEAAVNGTTADKTAADDAAVNGIASNGAASNDAVENGSADKNAGTEYDRDSLTERMTEMNLQISEKERALNNGGGDAEAAAQEEAKEALWELECMMDDLASQSFFDATYGEYGISYRLPENRLYMDEVPVSYFYDEENGGALWADNDGEICINVVRDENGEITALSVVDSAGNGSVSGSLYGHAVSKIDTASVY
ncbi:MAG: M56 family metallopeptidase [Lachnospiraceae bacterium]|nr:M56 family metallopeptidase [Lachnospiraceae bacterium]